MKIIILIFFNIFFSFVLAAQNVRTSNLNTPITKKNLSLAIGETVLIGEAKKMRSIDNTIFTFVSGYLGKENLVPLASMLTHSQKSVNQKAKVAKYLVFFTISVSKNYASLSSMLYEQSTMNIIATNLHTLYDLPNGLDNRKLTRILNRQCINIKTMIHFNEANPNCDKDLILDKWKELDKESIKQNKGMQKEIYDDNAENLADNKIKVPKVIDGNPTEPKVIDVLPTITDDEIIKNLSDDDKQYYQQKANAENKTLIEVIKEDKKQNVNDNVNTDDINIQTGKADTKTVEPKDENERVPKPDLNKKFEDLSKVEKDEYKAIASYTNTNEKDAFETAQKDQFMMFLNDGNCPTILLDLNAKELSVFKERSKFWNHTDLLMFSKLKTVKDYYVNLKKNFFVNTKPKNSKLDVLEKFAAKLNPGMTLVNSSEGKQTEFEEVCVAHKSTCDNFIIVGGSITFVSTVSSKKFGTSIKKYDVKINVTGNNTAFADCIYSNNENIVIAGAGESKQEELGIKKEKIQLYFQYTSDNFYRVKFSNLGAVVFGKSTQAGMTENLEYYKNFEEEFKVEGIFSCTKSDRFLTIKGSSINPTSSSTKSKVNATDDALIRAIAELPLDELEAQANKLKSEYAITTNYSVIWDLKLQRVSEVLGKIKDIEINNKGKVIKDNTFNNAPKITN